MWFIYLFVGSLTSQQHASVSQGRICTDNFTCCHTEIEAADQTFYLTQSQYTDTGPTSPSADPITPGAWQGSHWSANFLVTGMTRPRKKSRRKRCSNPGSSALEADALPLGQRGGCVGRKKWRNGYVACLNADRPEQPNIDRLKERGRGEGGGGGVGGGGGAKEVVDIQSSEVETNLSSTTPTLVLFQRIMKEVLTEWVERVWAIRYHVERYTVHRNTDATDLVPSSLAWKGSCNLVPSSIAWKGSCNLPCTL